MSNLQQGGAQKQKKRENALMQNAIEILDDEKESILTEILRCNVCLELPEGKQVKICEEGHHFCSTCHKEMKMCGICRGKLLETRNFVVEQIVTRLGAVLGISKKLPDGEPPVKSSKGMYSCLHECRCKVTSFQMLPHIREKHSSHLIDNVRSNPYNGRFSFTYKLDFTPDNKYILSAHVSDMGLFTVELTLSDLDFFGCVRILGDKTVSVMFKYQLLLKLSNEGSDSSLEFSITDCPVSSYLDDTESIRNGNGGLKIKREAFLETVTVGAVITVFFSIWRKNGEHEIKKSPVPSVTCLSEKSLFFENNRKSRRNINRNTRRKRLKEKLKNLALSEEAMVEGFSDLSLAF